jgi:predicted component of type VI protein secretion system
MEKGLGQQSLGDDMVCGNSFMEEYPAYCYTIGPLEQGNVSACLPGGALYTVLETFNRFFVPAEASTETEITIDMQTAGMILGPGREPILGYSSMLAAG